MRSLLPIPLASLLSVFLLVPAGCDLSDSTSGPVPTNEGDTHSLSRTQEWRYSVQGDSLVLDPAAVEIFSYCSIREGQGGEWVDEFVVDTVQPYRAAWAIVGDTLRFDIRLDTSYDRSAEDEVLATGISRKWSALVRQGRGAGLEGAWRQVGNGREWLAGTRTRTSQAEDMIEADFLRFHPMTFTFSQGALVRSGYSQEADNFLATWNGEIYRWDSTWLPDSAVYDLAVRKLDETRVELRGRKTGEVVTIQWSNSGISYASSVAAHGRHVYAFNPASCPNPYEPDWMPLFRYQNQKRAFATGLQAGHTGSAGTARAAIRPTSPFGASSRPSRAGW